MQILTFKNAVAWQGPVKERKVHKAHGAITRKVQVKILQLSRGKEQPNLSGADA